MIKKVARGIVNLFFGFPKKGTIVRRKLFGYQAYIDLHEFQSKKAILGVYEIKETNFLKKNIKSEDYCLNVGANFGYYTYLLASKANHVIAIEAVPFLQNLIEKTINDNKIDNVSLIKKACGSSNGTIKFLENVDNTGLSSPAYGERNVTENEIEVSIIKVDDLIFQKLDIVVIDVEGFEMEVLKGMAQTLTNFKPRLLMIELYDPYLNRFNTNVTEVVHYLQKLGYVPMELNNSLLTRWGGGRVYNDNFFFVYE